MMWLIGFLLGGLDVCFGSLVYCLRFDFFFKKCFFGDSGSMGVCSQFVYVALDFKFVSKFFWFRLTL